MLHNPTFSVNVEPFAIGEQSKQPLMWVSGGGRGGGVVRQSWYTLSWMLLCSKDTVQEVAGVQGAKAVGVITNLEQTEVFLLKSQVTIFIMMCQIPAISV